MKYSSTVRPSRKEERIGRSMMRPAGATIRPRIPAICAIWLMLPLAPLIALRYTPPHSPRPALIGDEAHVERVLDLGDGPVGGGEEFLLLLRHLQVVHGDGDAGLGGELEADVLHPVNHLGGTDVVQLEAGLRDQVLEALLVHSVVAGAHLLREHLVEDDPPRGSLDKLAVCPGVADAYAGAEVQVAHIVGHLGLVEAAVYALEGAVAVGGAELPLVFFPAVA